MQLSQIPNKFPIPWGASAGSGFIRAIPEASQIGIQAGAASLTDGFVPVNFMPVGSGGVPPFGQDMNGILNQITLWNQWNSAGGLSPYDSVFSAAIGGYPQNAVLASTTSGIIWLNLVDNNTSNPDASGANWVQIPSLSGSSIGHALVRYGIGGGTADVITTTLTPAITAYYDGMIVELKPSAPNATTTPTLNANTIGNVTIVRNDGTACQAGDLQTDQRCLLLYDAATTQFQILGLITSNLPASGVFSKFTHGTANFTVPAGITRIKKLRAWGAGGGGGGANDNAASGGGAGGGYIEVDSIPVTPGQVIAITVGTGGTGGTGAPTFGNTGGTTQIGTSGSIANVPGGGGGTPGSSSVGGPSSPGAVPTAGSGALVVAFQGGAGSGGFAASGTVFGGGGGGPSSNGGAGAPPLSVNGTGGAGTSPGGGGAGTAQDGSGGQAGGAGADGAVVIEY